MNVKEKGQVFTPNTIVKKMISLISISNPEILEPASGDGAFYKPLLKKFGERWLTAYELDKDIAHKGAIISDFFKIKEDKKYDVIIGNPPYVDFRYIPLGTLSNIESKLIHKPNLYMFFLEKTMRMLKENGELIFIMPVEWIVSSSFESSIKIIKERFSIQHFEIVKEDIWENAKVTTAIFKIKKGDHKKINYYFTKNNKIIFGEKPIIDRDFNVLVKVGAASGNNSTFYNCSESDTEFVLSMTERTSQLYPAKYESVKNFWIRKLPIPMEGFTYQIFVNTKTRKKEPFYMIQMQKKSQVIHYDASVLTIYTDASKKETINYIKKLNNVNWEKTGILRNGKYHFTQSILKGFLENE